MLPGRRPGSVGGPEGALSETPRHGPGTLHRTCQFVLTLCLFQKIALKKTKLWDSYVKQKNSIKKIISFLSQHGSAGWALSHTPKGRGSNSRSGHIPEFGVFLSHFLNEKRNYFFSNTEKKALTQL